MEATERSEKTNTHGKLNKTQLAFKVKFWERLAEEMSARGFKRRGKYQVCVPEAQLRDRWTDADFMVHFSLHIMEKMNANTRNETNFLLYINQPRPHMVTGLILSVEPVHSGGLFDPSTV